MKLPKSEELDFHYLLSLMRPLHQIDEFGWLPELFSIIGHERLITLCRYAGGETIRIPKLEELSDSVDALQFFYNVYIKHSIKPDEIPESLKSLVATIKEVYDARDD